MQGIELTPSEVALVIDGLKTQKRVPIIPNKHLVYTDEFWERIKLDKDVSLCPYGKVGDTLFVKEDWKVGAWTNDGYFAFDHSCEPYDTSWHKCPNVEVEAMYLGLEYDLHTCGMEEIDGKYTWDKFESPLTVNRAKTMREWMSRIKLKITEIRIERLQDISEKDAIAEGGEQIIGYECIGMNGYDDPLYDEFVEISAKSNFKNIIWKQLPYPPEYRWEANPLVWVIGFEVSDGDSNA